MKKVLFMVLCFVMLMAVPMAACAEDEDYSPEATTQKKKTKKPSKSPKTADNSMASVALVLLAVSGGIIYISRREFDRA